MSGLEAPLEFGLGGGEPFPAPKMELVPAGTIGLVDDDPVVLLRFDETLSAITPKDSAGGLNDLGITTGIVAPAVVDGFAGRARRFNASVGSGLIAKDIDSGSTLLTRDISIQIILRADVAGQASYGSPGVIIQRGYGFAVAGATETRSYALVLDTADQEAGCAILQWQWQDTGGTGHVQPGAIIRFPDGFTMLTATRRWVAPDRVIIRYYAGDQLIGEDESADGSIGGATTGTMQIGCSAMSGGAFGRTFVGDIDEILVVDREMTREEIEATWLRLTRYQPLGVQLIRELHDQGFPLPTDPASDVQLDLRMTGNALGFAAAQAENVRVNILPQRSYGTALEDWETAVRATPQPSEGVDERRARVVAKIRQRRGSTPLGFQDALAGLLGGADVDQLEFIAFSNEVDDDFTTLNTLRWDVLPNGDSGKIDAISGAASFQPGAGTFLMNGATRSWVTMRQSVGGEGKQARQLVKLVWTTPQDTAEAGIYFENAVTGDYLLLGLRDVAGSFQVKTESFIAGVSQGLVAQATIGANPAAIWLHLYQTSTDGTWKAAWSTTSATSGFTTSANITHPTAAQWGGCYLRSTGAIAAPRADFDDHRLLMPFSGRPFNAYILLDRDLGFSPDIDGANSVVSAIKHGFVHGAFITNRELLTDDPDGGAGVAPFGGY